MNKQSLFFTCLLSIAILFTSACSDGKPVATYDGGVITRGELKASLKGYPHTKQKQVVELPAKQIEEINALVSRKLYLQEAQKRGIQKQPAFQQELQNEVAQLKRTFYFSKIFPESVKLTKQDKVKLTKKYDFNLIYGWCTFYQPKSIHDHVKARIKEAYELVKKAGGTNFKEVATNYSEYYYRGANDGSFPVIDYFGNVPGLMDVVTAMNEGEIKFFQFPHGYLVVRLNKVIDKPKEEVEKILNDKEYEKQLLEKKTQIEQNEYILEHILNSKDVKRYYEKLKENVKSNDVLLRFHGVTQYGSNFIAALQEQAPREGAPERITNAYENLQTNFKARVDFFEGTVAQNALLTEYFATLSIEGHPEYQEQYEMTRRKIMESYLIRAVQEEARKALNLTEETLRALYETNKMTRYFNHVRKNGKVVKEARPFEDVSNAIAYDLFVQTDNRTANEFKQTLFSNANVQYVTNNFLRKIPFPEKGKPKVTRKPEKKEPKVKGEKKEEKKKDTYGFWERLRLKGDSFKALKKAYDAINTAEKKDRFTVKREQHQTIEKANRTLVNVFRDRKRDAGLCVKAFKIHYENNATQKAREWIILLSEIEDYDLRHVKKLLDTTNDMKRALIYEALGYMNVPEGKEMLLAHVESEKGNTNTTHAIINAMGTLRTKDVVPTLEAYYTDSNGEWETRIRAADALARVTKQPYPVKLLGKALAIDDYAEKYTHINNILSVIHQDMRGEAYPILLSYFTNEQDLTNKMFIMQAMGNVKDTNALSLLEKQYKNKKLPLEARAKAAFALEAITGVPHSVDVFTDVAGMRLSRNAEEANEQKKEKFRVLAEAIASMEDIKDKDEAKKRFPKLLRLLKREKDPGNIILIFDAMKAIGDNRAVPVLEDYLYDMEQEIGVRIWAKEVLKHLTGNPYTNATPEQELETSFSPKGTNANSNN